MSAEAVAVQGCPRCAELERRLAQMTERVLALEQEVRELRARLAQDSSNSSMPPSSDPAWKRPPPVPPTGRRPGGQPGHAGHFRQRLPASQVQHHAHYFPRQCEKCQAPLTEAPAAHDPAARWHQIAELPARPVEITEHQAHGRHCPACGHLTWAVFPPGLTAHVLGPRLSAFLAYCTGRLHLSRRQVEEIAEDLLQVPLGLGTVSAL